MFCRMCGAELQDGAKFCTVCGASQAAPNATGATQNNLGGAGVPPVAPAPQAAPVPPVPPTSPVPPVPPVPPTSPVPPVEKGPSVMSELFKEAKELILKFFSKDPLAAVKQSADSSSFLWTIFIGVCVLLYPLFACINAAQYLNYLLGHIIKATNSMIGSAMGLGGLLSGSGIVPSVKIPVSFDMYGALLLVAVIVAALEFGLIYLILLIRNQKPKSPLCVLNVVAVADLPLLAAVLIGTILGLLFAPVIMAVLTAGEILHLIFLYEGMKELGGLEKAPIWEFAVFVLIMGILVVIISSVMMNSVLGSVMDVVEDYVKSMTGGVSGILDSLF